MRLIIKMAKGARERKIFDCENDRFAWDLSCCSAMELVTLW